MSQNPEEGCKNEVSVKTSFQHNPEREKERERSTKKLK
jgi:hypothetical protein